MHHLVPLLLLAFAAVASFGGDTPVPSAPAAKGALVFSDDFNRAELGDAWRITTPVFEISDGMLKATQVHADRSMAGPRHDANARRSTPQMLFSMDDGLT